MFKNKLIVTAALTAILSVPAFADSSTPPQAMSAVADNITQAGYIVNSIKYDNGAYEANVINSAGKEVDLSIDSNGNLQVNKTQPLLSLESAAKKVEAQGYKIVEIAFDDDEYDVSALNQNNKEVELVVNAFNGNISKAGKLHSIGL